MIHVFFTILFQVVVDLFRNDKMNGFVKALWIIFLIVVPFLSLLIYVIVYHKGMQERQVKEVQQFQQAQDAYIKQVAGSSKSPASTRSPTPRSCSTRARSRSRSSTR